MVLDIIQNMREQKISGSYLAVLRFTLGLAWLGTWINNYLGGVFTPEGFIGTIEYFINDPRHTITPIDSIIRSFLFPNAQFFVYFHFISEGFIALSLVFGVFTRAGSAVGAFLSIFFMFGTLGVDWIFTYVLMIVGFFICGMASAGNWYGLDYWVRDKIPQKLTRVLV